MTSIIIVIWKGLFLVEASNELSSNTLATTQQRSPGIL